MLALLTALLLPTALAGPGGWYTIPASSSGLESVSASFFIDPASPRITGYYAANQWSFTGHDVQYFGLQPREPGGKTNGHLTYSVFGPGSTVGDPARCSGGADGGSGVSCALDINFDYGRWYTIESTVVAHKSDGSRQWNGTFIDDTGKRTYIASFWTDASYGALSGSVAQWLEWYKFNGDGKTPATRDCQPWFKVHYGLPKAGNVPGKVASLFKGTLDDSCAVKANTPNYKEEVGADGSMTITAGILNPK